MSLFNLAVQIWELFYILPFVIGKDMPPDDAHYACFKQLNDIATIVFSPVIADDQISLLRLYIEQYLDQFTSLYPQQPLTPKFHYLVHIPSLIRRYHVMHMYILQGQKLRCEPLLFDFCIKCKNEKFTNVYPAKITHYTV